LLPKKARQLIPDVAQKLDLAETLVDDVVSFYWKEVRKSITGLRHHSVYVETLGTFKAKSWKLDGLRKKYDDFSNHCTTNTFTRYALKKEAEDRRDKIQRIIDMLKQEDLKKQQIKKKRNEDSNDNMEK